MSAQTEHDTFTALGGSVHDGMPALHSPVFHTGAGTPYLRAPGVVLLARPHVGLQGMEPFLAGFDPSLGFDGYTRDLEPLPDGALLVKTAGQACYASWGPRRTLNADAARYIQRLIAQGHESVLEHASYSLLLYGVSRSLTHELVRHRFLSVSQLSQRYVSGAVLRFVERPEFQHDPDLHALFEARIDRAAREYRELTERLAALQTQGTQILSAARTTDLRKKVQQTARALLPNETETILVATANARAWRWILRLRGSPHTDTEIRELAARALLCLQTADPLLFGDLSITRLPDGTLGVASPADGRDHP